MKKLVFFVLLLSCFSATSAQNLDESLKRVCKDLADKLSKKQITHIGLYDFLNEDGKRDASVVYIQEQVQMYLINSPELQVMDRRHTAALLGENSLVSQGIIDATTIKKSVSFTKIDGWVEGRITNSGGQFKLELTVTDVNTSQSFAVSQTDWLDAESLQKISAPKPCPYCKGKGSIKTYIQCTTCNGTGGPKCPSCGGSGRDAISVGLGGNAKCNVCLGKGKIACKACDGAGRTMELATCTKCNGTGLRN